MAHPPRLLMGGGATTTSANGWWRTCLGGDAPAWGCRLCLGGGAPACAVVCWLVWWLAGLVCASAWVVTRLLIISRACLVLAHAGVVGDPRSWVMTRVLRGYPPSVSWEPHLRLYWPHLFTISSTCSQCQSRFHFAQAGHYVASFHF